MGKRNQFSFYEQEWALNTPSRVDMQSSVSKQLIYIEYKYYCLTALPEII